MKILLLLSNMMIPFLLLAVVITGLIKKVPIYDHFITGAQKGLKTVVKIVPTMIGLMVGVGVLRASGFLDMLSKVIGSVTVYIGLPGELVPSVIVRMFSSSAATGLVLDIFKKYGPDSLLGNTASLLMSSTETIFYTMSVYFMAASYYMKKELKQPHGITKTSWILPGAMLSTLGGILASVVLAHWM